MRGRILPPTVHTDPMRQRDVLTDFQFIKTSGKKSTDLRAVTLHRLHLQHPLEKTSFIFPPNHPPVCSLALRFCSNSILNKS